MKHKREPLCPGLSFILLDFVSISFSRMRQSVNSFETSKDAKDVDEHVTYHGKRLNFIVILLEETNDYTPGSIFGLCNIDNQ